MSKYKKLIIITILLLIILIIVKISNIYNIILKQMYPIKYSQYVTKYANEYNVDSFLIYSIIKAESNFKKDAISPSGAKGLMQLMDSTAEEIESKIGNPLPEENLLEVEKNIMIGAKYYSELSQKYNGNILLALAAYNAGIGNVNKWIEEGKIKQDGSDIQNIPFKETNMYVRKIINNYKMYQKIYK